MIKMSFFLKWPRDLRAAHLILRLRRKMRKKIGAPNCWESFSTKDFARMGGGPHPRLFNEIEWAEVLGKDIGLRVKAKNLPAGSYSFLVVPYLTWSTFRHHNGNGRINCTNSNCKQLAEKRQINLIWIIACWMETRARWILATPSM